MLIDNNIEFDGIFATNEWRAHGALVALQQHNISVPDKVKIVGYDGTYVSKYCNPSSLVMILEDCLNADPRVTLRTFLISSNPFNSTSFLVLI